MLAVHRDGLGSSTPQRVKKVEGNVSEKVYAKRLPCRHRANRDVDGRICAKHRAGEEAPPPRSCCQRQRSSRSAREAHRAAGAGNKGPEIPAESGIWRSLVAAVPGLAEP